jgi:D-glycero-alpha-D-manno-heptose-7-phosphate kinase
MFDVLEVPPRACNARALVDQAARVTKVRARAPLRLGFAGGGTDISPYCDTFGGCVLNATIGMFAHCSIELRNDWCVKFIALDHESEIQTAADAAPPPSEPFALHQAVHARIARQFLGGTALPVTVTTASDASAGSGLGSSSTLVVAMVQAYRELLALPLDEYQVAELAYRIEREDAGLAGGRQDQYAAAFGGINFIEFRGGQAMVNSLRVRPSVLMELEAMMVLYRTGISRDSSRIIREQCNSLHGAEETALQAMHQMGRDACVMKEALLQGDLNAFSDILARGWEAKKRTAAGITTPEIDRIHELALSAGALAGKVSGAGGGGYLFFLVPPERRPHLLRVLARAPGETRLCGFSGADAQAWRV